MTLSLSLIWLPRKIRATIATIAMRARMSAYSASPWPSSERRTRATMAESRCSNDIRFTSFPRGSPVLDEERSPADSGLGPVRSRYDFVYGCQ